LSLLLDGDALIAVVEDGGVEVIESRQCGMLEREL
jgi:hypothetical protein